LNASIIIFHYLRQRKIVIIIGAVLFTIGLIGAIIIGSIVINDTANNRLTSNGYPETQFLGISAFSYEYAFVFTTILGLFVLSGGLFGMDSKKKNKLQK
ncbi:MAG TPA: hypothetical protein VHJ38_06690, partial [Nitrososphaeraceae archaeon]|nr:hypothetical protein [Nitrososphaeraceae archaeon]